MAGDVDSVECPNCGEPVAVPRFEVLNVPPAKPGGTAGGPAGDSAPMPETVAPPELKAVDAGAEANVGRSRPGRVAPQPIYTATAAPSAMKSVRQWCFRVFFESRTGMLAVMGAVAVSGLVTWVLWSHSEFQRHDALVISAWDGADVAFRQANFVAAEKAYGRVVQRSVAWGRSGVRHARLARQMQEVAKQAGVVDSALNDTSIPLGEALFSGLTRSVAELLGPEPVPSPETDRSVGADDAPVVGLEFTPPRRICELLDGWLISRADRMAAKLRAVAEPSRKSVASLELLTRQLEKWQRDTSDLKAAIRQADDRIRRSGLTDRFTVASESVLKDYSVDSVRMAFDAWQKVQMAAGSGGDGAAWEAFVTKLRAKLTRESRVLTEDSEAKDESSSTVEPPVVEVPGGNATPIGEGHQVVFVNDEDRLLALDAETGTVGWARLRGFDNGWLPVTGQVGGKSVAVVSWQDEDGVYLSGLESRSGKVAWTRRLPVAEQELPDAPIVHEAKVLVVSRAGRVIQLDLASGKPLSRLQLPERLAATCVLDPREKRLACLGAQLGVYIVGLSSSLSVEAVHVRNHSVDLREARLVWVDSILLLLLNRPDSHCVVAAFREDAGQLVHLGADIEIDGHLWQQPPLLGNSLFLATDSGYLARLVVSPDSQKQPLRLVWSYEGDDLQLGTRPYVVSHAEAPLLIGFGRTVRASFFGMGEHTADRGVKTAWTWASPGEDVVICQPLQICSRGVVVATRRRGQAELFVECLDVTSGRRRWHFTKGATPQGAGSPTGSGGGAGNWSLVVGHLHPLDSLDPWNASLPLEREVVPLLFDRLLQPDGGGARYIKGPLVVGYGLRAGSRRSAGGVACQAFRFDLDTRRVFHDGSRVRPRDVVESIRRLSETRVRWHQREQSRMLRQSRSLNAGQVEVLVRPYLAARSLLDIYVAPHGHYAKIPKAGSSLSSVPVGSGPFQVVDRSRPREVVLRRNPHHPGSQVGTNGVREIAFRRFTASGLDEMVQQFRGGQLDVIAGLGTAELAALRARGVEGQVRSVATRRVAVLVFNQEIPPFDDMDLRHKLVRVLDLKFRRGVVGSVGEVVGGAAGVDSVFPHAGLAPDRDALPPLAENLFKTYMAQLNQAKAGRPLSVKVEANNWLAEKGAAAVADRLGPSKLTVNVERLTARQFQEEVRDRRSFELAICVLDFPDPLLNPGGLLDTRPSDRAARSLNFLGFDGQSLMQSIVDFRDAEDWSDVLAARRRLDDLVRDHAVVIPMWTDPQFAVFNRTVSIPPSSVTRSCGPWLFHRLSEWRRAI